MAALTKKIGFMGGGEICEVLVHNILANKIADPGNIFVYDIRPQRLEELHEKYGILPTKSNLEVVASSDYAFACVRSEYTVDLADEIAGADMTGGAIVTISSGVPMLLYESRLPGVAVARALPNPPSKIGEGAIVIAYNSACNKEQKTDVASLFAPMGKCFTIREDQIDAATSITCLAPVLSLFQASVEASVLMGIDLRTSQEMIMQTMKGGLKVWEGRPDKLGDILDQSATPGGITARMLYFLDRERFKYAVKGCIEEGAIRTKAFGDRIKEQLK